MITHLHHQIGREEFDYPALMSALSDYAKPKQKIGALLRKGIIIRVKKGLYVFGPDDRKRPYSRELLANLIYGPSFLSLDYALARHGLIPERVEVLSSVTTGRPKRFDTPVGRFIYRPTPAAAFHLGMQRVEQGDVAYLMASPERAIADKLREDRKAPIRSTADASRYLLEDLRVEKAELAKLDVDLLKQLAQALASRKVDHCAALIEKLRRQT